MCLTSKYISESPQSNVRQIYLYKLCCISQSFIAEIVSLIKTLKPFTKMFRAVLKIALALKMSSLNATSKSDQHRDWRLNTDMKSILEMGHESILLYAKTKRRPYRT